MLFALPASSRGRHEQTMDRGSCAARRQLLINSVETAVRHPAFGIGACNFQVTEGHWRVAHNTYTEVAEEGGSPAFVLFMLVLVRTFVNLRKVRQSEAYKQDPEFRGLTGGPW